MANTYVAPTFTLDTSTNVAGLITLKGSPIATTDIIKFNAGASQTLTIEQNLSILRFNFASNGWTVVQNANTTVTINDTTANTGFSGTATGTYQATGAVGTYDAVIVDAAPTKLSNETSTGLKFLLTNVELQNWQYFRLNRTDHEFNRVKLNNVYYGLYAASSSVVPKLMKEVLFYHCNNSLYDASNAGLTGLDWGYFWFRMGGFKIDNDATHGNSLATQNNRADGVERYVLLVTSDKPITLMRKASMLLKFLAHM